MLVYLAASAALLAILLPRMGTEIFPDVDAPLLRIRLRAPAGTRVEESERQVLHALDVIRRDIGPENIEITSDFVGVVPSSYPVNLIHLFTSGPQEAVIQIALKPGAPRGEPLREKLRASLRQALPVLRDLVRSRRHRQPGDELRIADADRSRRAGRQPAGRLRLRPEGAGGDGQAPLPARSPVRPGTELSHARHHHRPRARRTVRPDHGGRLAFGRARHIVLPFHPAELLARSRLRERLSDPGGVAAEPHAGRRGVGQRFPSCRTAAAKPV